VAAGDLYGKDQPIFLILLDIPMMEDKLKAVVMEIEDSAFPLVKGVLASVKEEEAFVDTDLVLMAGAFPRKEGMQRKDLLEKNATIFKKQGKLIAETAKPTVRVVVVGNPANTNALLALAAATVASSGKIPATSFTALTRLDHNRAKMQIALRLKVPVCRVHNIIIWGNHSNTQFPDISHAFVTEDDSPTSKRTPVADALATVLGGKDKVDEWLAKEFVPLVQNRGGLVIKARGASSAASASKAIIDHARDWLFGMGNSSETVGDDFVSMAVPVPKGGAYGIPEGTIFSFPVRCKAGGEYEIVTGLTISPFARAYLDKTAKELDEERTTAQQIGAL